MMDSAFNLLTPYLTQPQGKTLWLADENLLTAQLAANDLVTVISNRIDLETQLQQQQWRVFYSDYDFEQFDDNSMDVVVYRISKEKPVVHHIINQAHRCLKEDGQLILAGNKSEGIKTYFSKAKKLFGSGNTRKADKDTWLAELKKIGNGPLLDDKDYTELRETCADEQYSYVSKPGVYGWDKIDKGSAYLIEHLDSFLMTLAEPPKNALDLGCGYGYLSLNMRHLEIPITATDNNAAAISACQRNFDRHPINGQVIAANCAQGIREKFDLIVCNPPFHTGFSVDGDLTERFLRATHARLNNHGIACFVTNLHIPIERKALQFFHQAECIASNNHFKLVRISHPSQSFTA